MPVVQSDLAGLAKNMETAQKKLEKAKEKGPKGADKLASAIHAAEEVTQQWQSRAPFVFEQLQAVDEGRLNHLRDVLTQLGTHETDQVERCREVAESCLNALLNVETADEIKTFAAKVNGGRPVIARRQEMSPSATPTPAAAPPPIHDDVASQHSETPAPTPKVAPPGKTANISFKLALNGDSFCFPHSTRTPTSSRRSEATRYRHEQQKEEYRTTCGRLLLFRQEEPQSVCLVQAWRLA